MQAFQDIADANPGPDGHASRNSGEPGYLASAQYVMDKMKAAGYDVQLQTYKFPYSALSERRSSARARRRRGASSPRPTGIPGRSMATP